MALILRLRKREANGRPSAIITKARLDEDFYTLDEVIDMLDECVYSDATVDLLTARQTHIHVDPRKLSALGILDIEE